MKTLAEMMGEWEVTKKNLPQYHKHFLEYGAMHDYDVAVQALKEAVGFVKYSAGLTRAMRAVDVLETQNLAKEWLRKYGFEEK